MSQNKFEFFEGTLEMLDKLRQEEGRGPEEVAALESAAKALNYIFLSGKLDDFMDHLQEVKEEKASVEGLEPSFSSMSEATDWLHAQPEPRFGARMLVAGVPHIVVRQRTDTWFLIPAPPTPSLDELEQEED